MVLIFPTAFVSVPLDSFPLVVSCELGVIDSSNSYLFKMRVIFCPVFWVNFRVVFLVIIPRAGRSGGPNVVLIPGGCNDVREIVWL